MTVIVRIGRRVPKKWFRRAAGKVKGLITFQEHIWNMVNQGLDLAKRKANASGTIKFVKTKDIESEDLNYQIEWVKLVIQGTKAQEEDEYNDCMGLYSKLNKHFKKDFPTDTTLKKSFKTKFLNNEQMKEAYEKGFGCVGDNNIANKLLEMGILTHIEWLKDYKNRETEYNSDF